MSQPHSLPNPDVLADAYKGVVVTARAVMYLCIALIVTTAAWLVNDMTGHFGNDPIFDTIGTLILYVGVGAGVFHVGFHLLYRHQVKQLWSTADAELKTMVQQYNDEP